MKKSDTYNVGEYVGKEVLIHHCISGPRNRSKVLGGRFVIAIKL